MVQLVKKKKYCAKYVELNLMPKTYRKKLGPATVIPELGRQPQSDPWSWLARESGSLESQSPSESQATERLTHKN